MEHILACPRCNKSNRFGARVCGFCGQDMAYKCPHCHVDVDPGMAYCPYCGETLSVRSIRRNSANGDPSTNPDVVLELT